MTDARWIGDQNNPNRDLTDPNWISRAGHYALHQFTPSEILKDLKNPECKCSKLNSLGCKVCNPDIDINQEPQIRKANDTQRNAILTALMGEKQDPDVCKHRMISNHTKSNSDGFDGNYGHLVGKCLDCGSIILSHYELTGEEILTDKEWIEALYEQRDDWRGYGWYEKESEDK